MMSHNNDRAHAEKVVKHFRSTLPKSTDKLITQKHFDELTIMIQSAIDVAVISMLEHNAHKLEHLAKELRSMQKEHH